MSLFKKSLKIGRRVAVITFNSKKGRDEFMIGKIVAIRDHEHGDVVYAVRFDDGEIGLFDGLHLYTKWGEE